MFCRFCGKEILDDSKFCKFCGSPMNEIGHTAKVTTQKTPSINCVVSNTSSEPLRIELVKIKKPKFNINFSWDKYKSLIAEEIVCNAILLCVAIALTLLYLLGFRIYHQKDIQQVYITPIEESVYDKNISNSDKYIYMARTEYYPIHELKDSVKIFSGIDFLQAVQKDENYVTQGYKKREYIEKIGVYEDFVYFSRREQFKQELLEHAQYASWISVVVLILGRYLILMVKHYMIPFIKWIITNSKSNK